MSYGASQRYAEIGIVMVGGWWHVDELKSNVAGYLLSSSLPAPQSSDQASVGSLNNAHEMLACLLEE